MYKKLFQNQEVLDDQKQEELDEDMPLDCDECLMCGQYTAQCKGCPHEESAKKFSKEMGWIK